MRWHRLTSTNHPTQAADSDRAQLQHKLDNALAALCEQQQAESQADASLQLGVILDPPDVPDAIRAASVADAWPTGDW